MTGCASVRVQQVSTASWERLGAPDTGLGGIRRVGKGLNVTRDHVVAGSRPNLHAYEASTPRRMPIKDYRGDIRIEDRENGSFITWSVVCTPSVPGLSGLFESRLQSVYARLAAALAREAERR